MGTKTAVRSSRVKPVAEKKYFLVDKDGDANNTSFDSIEAAVKYSEGCSFFPYEVFEAVKVGDIVQATTTFVPLA